MANSVTVRVPATSANLGPAPSHRLTLYAPGASIQERKDNATRVGEALVPANTLAGSLGRGEPLSKALGPSKVCP